MQVLMIQRAAQFSPNSVEKDLAILEAVAVRLRDEGYTVRIVHEKQLADGQPHPDACIFSMGRLPETLAWLKSLHGIKVINTPEGIENCARSRLQTILSQCAIPVPPQEGHDGYWLKRGDAAAQSKDDVQFAATKAELLEKTAAFEARGIHDYVVSAHVVGDLVKFYGVAGTGFFRYYYPTDDRQSKFGDEQRNGEAHHYVFDEARLQQQMEQLAGVVGLQVYGGDCIIRSDGSWVVIDFNDWPSFSRCREEAASAIAKLI
jgi:hypothetical protein